MARTLVEAGYSYRQVARFLGYKAPRSVQLAVEAAPALNTKAFCDHISKTARKIEAQIGKQMVDAPGPAPSGAAFLREAIMRSQESAGRAIIAKNKARSRKQLNERLNECPICRGGDGSPCSSHFI